MPSRRYFWYRFSAPRPIRSGPVFWALRKVGSNRVRVYRFPEGDYFDVVGNYNPIWGYTCRVAYSMQPGRGLIYNVLTGYYNILEPSGVGARVGIYQAYAYWIGERNIVFVDNIYSSRCSASTQRRYFDEAGRELGVAYPGNIITSHSTIVFWQGYYYHFTENGSTAVIGRQADNFSLCGASVVYNNNLGFPIEVGAIARGRLFVKHENDGRVYDVTSSPTLIWDSGGVTLFSDKVDLYTFRLSGSLFRLVRFDLERQLESELNYTLPYSPEIVIVFW